MPSYPSARRVSAAVTPAMPLPTMTMRSQGAHDSLSAATGHTRTAALAAADSGLPSATSLTVEDELALVVEVHELRGRLLAEAVALAPRTVENEPHAGTTSRTGSSSMLRVMLLGTRRASPTTRRSTRAASEPMMACASRRASPWPAQPCGP